jgi:hypothetical protein
VKRNDFIQQCPTLGLKILILCELCEEMGTVLTDSQNSRPFRCSASGIATITTIKADGTQTIATSQYGLPESTQQKDKNGNLLQTVSQIYDDPQRPYTLTTLSTVTKVYMAELISSRFPQLSS